MRYDEVIYLNFAEKKEKLLRYRKLLQKSKILENELKEFEMRSMTLATHITPGESDKIITSGGNRNLNKIEAYAKQQLGMQKPDKNQTIYVDTSIDEGTTQVEKTLNVFEKIVENIKDAIAKIF